MQSDSVVVVMGATGTGKSSFIQMLTDDMNIEVGDGLQSKTSEVRRAARIESDGRSVTLVDTPGFDDSHEVSDADVLKKIATFLEAEYNRGKKLDGIVYLHRITDPRMGGVSVRNLRMFRKLCGSEALENVIVVTTRWDELQDKTVGIDREKGLKRNAKFFKKLADAGAQFFRHDHTKGSCQKILKQLLNNIPVVLQIQEELAEGMDLDETEAGAELNAQITDLIKKHLAELENLREEMQEAMAEEDLVLQRDLKLKRKKRKRKAKKLEGDMAKLVDDLTTFRNEAVTNKKAWSRELKKKKKKKTEAVVGVVATFILTTAVFSLL